MEGNLCKQEHSRQRAQEDDVDKETKCLGDLGVIMLKEAGECTACLLVQSK